MTDFETYLLVFGLLLAAGALLSGLAHRSILSLAVFFMVAGILLGPQAAGVLQLEAGSELVTRVTELTLIVILFTDGLAVEEEMLRSTWRVPLRSLIIAMPLTAVFIALAAAGLLGLSWQAAFLLGALLSPTDPVLTSSVISNIRIPLRVRHSLNLESGFNDGLALPAVLLFASALGGPSDGNPWWVFVARDILVGAAVGLAGAFLSIWLLRALRGRMQMVAYYRSLYAFAAALSIYGVAHYLKGNGFIAVFVAGIAMAALLRQETESYESFSRHMGEVLKTATFVIFGSLLSAGSLLAGGVSVVLFALFVLFVARTIALLPSLLGTSLVWPERLFMAWFGPRGVACIAYGLLLIGMGVPQASQLFDIAALVIFSSIILHGISDTPLANWFGRRSQSQDQAGREEAVPERQA